MSTDFEIEPQLAVVDVAGNRFVMPLAALVAHCSLLKGHRFSTTMVRIQIHGIRPEIFQLIEEHIRTGSPPKLTIQNVVDVYCASFGLHMKQLAASCLKFIFESRREDQSLVYYVECITQNMQKDENELLNFVHANFANVVAAERFTDLTEDQLIRLLSNELIITRPESERISAALRWLHYDCAERKEASVRVLRSFNYSHPAFRRSQICSEIYSRIPELEKIKQSTLMAADKTFEPISKQRKGSIEKARAHNKIVENDEFDPLKRTSLEMHSTVKELTELASERDDTKDFSRTERQNKYDPQRRKTQSEPICRRNFLKENLTSSISASERVPSRSKKNRVDNTSNRITVEQTSESSSIEMKDATANDAMSKTSKQSQNQVRKSQASRHRNTSQEKLKRSTPIAHHEAGSTSNSEQLDKTVSPNTQRIDNDSVSRKKSSKKRSRKSKKGRKKKRSNKKSKKNSKRRNSRQRNKNHEKIPEKNDAEEEQKIIHENKVPTSLISSENSSTKSEENAERQHVGVDEVD